MPVGIWLAVTYPVAFLVLLAVGVVCAVLLLRWIIGGLVSLAQRLRA